MEINQSVAVTDDPEFCLRTTPLYIDTRNSNCRKCKLCGEKQNANLAFDLFLDLT